MNDPGFDEPIDELRAQIEKKDVDERQEAEEEEQSYLAPSRWWFASTAIPLIAGTFGPMASAFSICALVVHWRIQVLPGGSQGNGVAIDDPAWLIGINAAQLAVALLSNLFLLLNMAERIRFSIAQPITIIGWFISAFTLIALLATGTGPLKLGDDITWAWSQGYWYAIWAAALYLLVSMLMCVTIYGAYAGQYAKNFQLTMSQRSLMLQTILYLIYLLVGAAVWAHLEGWAYLDAVYWANFTLLTIGIGDLAPQTDVGRGLLFPYAIGGIIILGLVIGSIRGLILERGKVKMEARMIEKERERMIKKMIKSGKASLLIPVKSNDQSSSTSMDSDKRVDDKKESSTERQRRAEEFDLMRKVIRRATARRRWVSLAVSLTTWLVLWFAGAAVFQATELAYQDWSYYNGVYFAYTSLLTIGYGDLYPETNAGKAFFVFWSLLAIPSLTILISNAGDTVVKGFRDLTLKIGEFTVLPGETGVKATFKKALHQMTGGKLFDENDFQETPPGLLGESSRRDPEAGEDDNRRHGNEPDSAAQRVEGDDAQMEKNRAEQHVDSGNRVIPEDETEYCCLLVKEIGHVIKHLNSNPPRKYSYNEWAWYLKLIGENESSSQTHRQAPRKPKPHGEGLGTATAGGETQEAQRKTKWSWVGNRSPLMGSKAESEWILERLQLSLQEQLEHMRKQEKKDGSGKSEKGKTTERNRHFEEDESDDRSSHTTDDRAIMGVQRKEEKDL